MPQIKFNGSIKQYTPKKLVSGDNGLRLLLEIPMPNKETLEGISSVFLSQANLTENVIITLEV